MSLESAILDVRPGNEPWLEDHRPQGNRVVAGAVLAEWLLGPDDRALRDLRFRRPLRVPDGGARVVRESAREDGVEKVRLVAPRVGPDGATSGTTRVAEAGRVAPPAAAAVAGPLGEEASRRTSIDPTFHGPTYRVLTAPVRHGHAGLDASIRIAGEPPSVAPWRSGRDVRLLDGMFQAAGLCRTRAGLVRGAPFRASVLRWDGTAGMAGRFEARVRWVDPARPEEMILWCLDPSGRIVIEIAGYHAAPAGFMSGGSAG